MLELNRLVNMTKMANKTKVPHDWVTWPPGVKQMPPVSRLSRWKIA